MKLLIAGNYIQIDDFVELVSESPLINNFDAQYAQYSNTFEVKYSGDIADLIDISKLRTTASPYLMIDGYLIDGVIFIPITIIINSFDPNKNTIKMNVSERFPTFGGINPRTTKLTELRHKLAPDLGGGDIDEIVLPDSSVDIALIPGDAKVLMDDPDSYPRAITPNNWCPLVSIQRLVTFLNFRYGLEITGAPDGNFFANRQLPFCGDLIKGSVVELATWTTSALANFSIQDAPNSVYPAGIDSNGYLPSGSSDKLVKYTNITGDDNQRFMTCVVRVSIAEPPPDPANFFVSFKGQLLDFLGVDVTGYLLTFGIEDRNTEWNLYMKSAGTDFHAANFVVGNQTEMLYKFSSDVHLFVNIPNNTAQATSLNSRQIFQNMPDVTIIDFFKTIAKASAKYLELTATGFKFVNIAESLQPTAIVDASPHLIDVKGISYALYDSPALEYWYKDATTATLIVPITDTRVKGAAKKIEIAMLRTDNGNVSLFESDGVKPLAGIATYPFLDITNQAVALEAFYTAIQNPFVVTATFKNFGLNLSNSVLIRQLNGLFVPKKIIKTNRDIIELELLKIEMLDFGSDIIITENNTFVLICEDATCYIAQEGE